MSGLVETGLSTHCPPESVPSVKMTWSIALSGRYTQSTHDSGSISVSAFGRIKVSRSVFSGKAWVEYRKEEYKCA